MACFYHSCFDKGVWRCLLADVSVWGHATSFNVMVTSPRTPAGALKMSVRLPEWCVANLTVRKSCEGRIRKRSRIQQSIYPTWRIFGIIFTFLGWGRDAFVGRHRSLTAAQAATGFTRNCVLGFTRKRPNFPREARYEVMQSALTALCVPPFVFLLRCLVVPRVRYGERYALFISTGANAGAMRRNKTEWGLMSF